MDSKEVHPEEIIQHEHPLILEDLQSMYQNYKEDDDEIDDLDLISMQKFKCTCDICGFEIDWYHRYYYKCSHPSCSYSLHKFCKEMSTTFRFPAHPIHTLHLTKMSNSWSCHACLTEHHDGICYRCSACDYDIDLRCVTFAEQNMIHHPGHPHPLISFTTDPISIMCSCCGKEHKGVFYHCSTCFNFSIHIDCVTRPFKFDSNHHVHKLTLSYSFTAIPYYSKLCKICGTEISEETWLYKCSKCRYYAHLDCSTLSSEIGRTDANMDVADYLDLLHYPLPDDTCNILPNQVLRGNYQYFDQIRFDKGFYIHSSHHHTLVLISAPDTSISGTPPTPLHDPMKRIKLLCDGCLRPITTMPFYVCSQAASGCCFHLHEWCTSLPTELKGYPYHPEHTLVLCYNPQDKHEITYFWCKVCDLRCNGFAYGCKPCNYLIDVHCAFISETIMHEAHPNHLLIRELAPSFRSESTAWVCNACRLIHPHGVWFRCRLCDFSLDCRCALHMPKTIRNKYDKHPLTLSYSPIENHKSEYFCEVCEDYLTPELWFYHCKECGQSIHSACAPLILQSEQDVNDGFSQEEGVYRFLNIKFGGSIYSHRHQHPLSFLAGTKSDGCCYVCGDRLQSSLMLKCFQCNDAFHIECKSQMLNNREGMRLLIIPEKNSNIKPSIQVKLQDPSHDTGNLSMDKNVDNS